ncbi:hypothetical protein AB0N06_33065 [Streptomyces sp. NPDC051020]|uniref:hypothetical protein n=1 Tax=Streptomyces sp. NPDC051020 TaxID=3155409 RepID=UPI00343CEF3E
MDAFLAEGYRCAEAELIGQTVPYVEQRRNYLQTYTLQDSTRGVDDLPELEVTLQNSQVGALVFVRRADRGRIRWQEKPPPLSFPVAHHEVADTDFGPRLRDILTDLPGLHRLNHLGG